MRAVTIAAVVAVLLFAGCVAAGATGTAAAAAPAASSSPVTGNITGPTVLGYGANASYTIDASGGPAFAANGTQVGNLTYYVTLAATNTTGITVAPSHASFANGTATAPVVTAGDVTEVLTLEVEITSVYQSANVSLNFTYAVNIVQPYVLSLSLVCTSSVTVIGFPLTVDLDGAPVGVLHIPDLTSGQAYVATFDYATTGLSPGEHTFTVSLANEHGLVTFAGGASTYSTSFYVAGAAANYTLWYVAGAVAFFGAIFIFVTRVAARRRAPARK